MAAALLLERQSLAANPFLFSAHGLRYRKLEVILTTVTPPLSLSSLSLSLSPFINTTVGVLAKRLPRGFSDLVSAVLSWDGRNSLQKGENQSLFSSHFVMMHG
jgi:hypothetical protein